MATNDDTTGVPAGACLAAELLHGRTLYLGSDIGPRNPAEADVLLALHDHGPVEDLKTAAGLIRRAGGHLGRSPDGSAVRELADHLQETAERAEELIGAQADLAPSRPAWLTHERLLRLEEVSQGSAHAKADDNWTLGKATMIYGNRGRIALTKQGHELLDKYRPSTGQPGEDGRRSGG